MQWTGPSSGERRFMDELADYTANMGLPALGGKVYGWLLVAEPSCQTIAEIERAVHAPEAPIIEMVETLCLMGLVEQLDVPGKGLACFAARSLSSMLERRLAQVSALEPILARAVDQAPVEHHEARRRLSEMRNWMSAASQLFARPEIARLNVVRFEEESVAESSEK